METAFYQRNVLMWSDWWALLKSFWHVTILHL